jgi:hypothetical protein
MSRTRKNIGGSRGRNFRHRKCTVVSLPLSETCSFSVSSDLVVKWNPKKFQKVHTYTTNDAWAFSQFLSAESEECGNFFNIFRNTKDYFLQLNVLYTVVASSTINMLLYVKLKGGQSVNNIRKSADLNNLLDLRSFRKRGTLRICDLQTQLFFWNLRI